MAGMQTLQRTNGPEDHLGEDPTLWRVRHEHQITLSDVLVYNSSREMNPIEAGVKAGQRGRPEIVALVMHECTLFDVKND